MKTSGRNIKSSPRMGAPYLRGLTAPSECFNGAHFPFNVPAFRRGIDLEFKSNVTFVVGENGSGKSTLLEAIAECCGFNPEGGNKDHYRETFTERSELAKALRLSWLPKTTQGLFSIFGPGSTSDVNDVTVAPFFKHRDIRLGGKSRIEDDHRFDSIFDDGEPIEHQFQRFCVRDIAL